MKARLIGVVFLLLFVGLFAASCGSKEESTSWQEAAVDLIANYPNYTERFYLNGDYMAFELIDFDNDSYPEILTIDYPISGSINPVGNVWRFDGNTYCEIDLIGKNTSAPILPVMNTKEGGNLFVSHNFYEIDLGKAKDMIDIYLIDLSYVIAYQYADGALHASEHYTNKEALDYGVASKEEKPSLADSIVNHVESFIESYPVDSQIPYYVSDTIHTTEITCLSGTNVDRKAVKKMQAAKYRELMPPAQAELIIKSYTKSKVNTAPAPSATEMDTVPRRTGFTVEQLQEAYQRMISKGNTADIAQYILPEFKKDNLDHLKSYWAPDIQPPALKATTLDNLPYKDLSLIDIINDELQSLQSKYLVDDLRRLNFYITTTDGDYFGIAKTIIAKVNDMGWYFIVFDT